MSQPTIRAKRKQVSSSDEAQNKQLPLFPQSPGVAPNTNWLNKLPVASISTQSYGVDATRQLVEGYPQRTGSPQSPLDRCEPNECKGELKMEETKKRKTYRQRWREYNLAQTQEKAHFEVLLHDLCRGVDAPVQTFGRPRLKLGDIIFCLAYKTYTGFSGRRLATDLREVERRGFIEKAPHFNSLYLYQATTVTSCLQTLIARSALPLRAVETDVAVDSSGFSTGVYERWFNVKYGEIDRKGWLKMHLICGVRTNIVIGVEMSGPHAGDYPFFTPLVNRAKDLGFDLKEISADRAYLGAENLRTTLLAGAMPYIPFKENSVPDGGGTVWKRLYHFYSYHNDEFKAHYHKRSNIESTFSMIKRTFGERLRSKIETAQINEALTKVLCHNLCRLIHSMYELEIEPTFCEELLLSQIVSQ